jgi:hypothetical protein
MYPLADVAYGPCNIFSQRFCCIQPGGSIFSGGPGCQGLNRSGDIRSGTCVRLAVGLARPVPRNADPELNLMSKSQVGTPPVPVTQPEIDRLRGCWGSHGVNQPTSEGAKEVPSPAFACTRHHKSVTAGTGCVRIGLSSSAKWKYGNIVPVSRNQLLQPWMSSGTEIWIKIKDANL